jgi:AcrR family transcriptional regulator
LPRSGEDARRRLQGAALELWSERGYERTTTAEIAARAGVTDRTFFRHFPDKREVLFDGAAEMRGALVRALGAAPAQLAPLKALQHAFAAVAPMFEQNRAHYAVRERVIAETPALRERQLAKMADLTSAMTSALMARGFEERRTRLICEVAMATFVYATAAWAADAKGSLETHLDQAFDELHAFVE